MRCWRSCLWGRRNACEARKNSGGRFKTSKHCAICFFRIGRSRENPADWHARQQAQLKHLRADLDLRDLRGNVDTRLRKVESGEYEAVMVAKAGLDRLGLSQRISEVLSPEVCMPAVGQGAIAVECRLKDTEAAALLAPLDDAETRTAILAERALLSALQGGCQVPMGAWARIERNELLLDACVCSVDGAQYVKQRATAPPDQAAQLGEHMARVLLEAGAQSILEEVSRQRG